MNKKEFIEKWFSENFNLKVVERDLNQLLDNWISCKDELPKDKKGGYGVVTVLVYFRADCKAVYRGTRHTMAFHIENKVFVDSTSSTHKSSAVTHWQPLPKPPKEEK